MVTYIITKINSLLLVDDSKQIVYIPHNFNVAVKYKRGNKIISARDNNYDNNKIYDQVVYARII